MSFRNGQKVLIEATVVVGRPDDDGEIKVNLPRYYGTEDVYVPASRVTAGTDPGPEADPAGTVRRGHATYVKVASNLWVGLYQDDWDIVDGLTDKVNWRNDDLLIVEAEVVGNVLTLGKETE